MYCSPRVYLDKFVRGEVVTTPTFTDYTHLRLHIVLTHEIPPIAVYLAQNLVFVSLDIKLVAVPYSLLHVSSILNLPQEQVNSCQG